MTGMKILLSFDTEEFDVPKEHGVDFTLEQGMEVSREGTRRILDVLKQNGVKATFFCTGNFARLAPEVMQRIMDEGHEVACHGVDHWQPKETDFVESKQIVEQVTGLKVNGYRQPRMFPVVESEIKPLFWLSLHNLPEGLYHWLVRRTLKHDGHFVTYFHPWEFYDLKEHPEFKMPFIIKNHSGCQMVQRLDNLIKMLKKQGSTFITYTDFVNCQ